MYFLLFQTLLVLVVSSHAGSVHDNNAFYVEWRSFGDIVEALKLAEPVVQTSLGLIKYTRQAPVKGHEVLMGYDTAEKLQSVLVYSATTATASASFTQGSVRVELLATATSFTVSYSSHNITNDDDVQHGRSVAARHYHQTDLSYQTRIRKYEGSGTVYGIRTDLPFLRNYRLVYGVGNNEYTRMGGSDTAMEAKCIQLTASMNVKFERDFGIHLTYIDFVKSELDIYRSFGINAVSPFFTETFGDGNYDIGVYLTEFVPNIRRGNGVAKLGGSFKQSLKGGCAIYADSGFVAHETGHLFGLSHPHTGVNFEPGNGYTIMAYTAQLDYVFNLGSTMEVNNWIDNPEPRDDTKQFYPVQNTNNAPQIDESRYKSVYHIGPSTSFRFTVEGNDPDEGDELQYYVQQLNYNTTVFEGRAFYENRQVSLYQRNLTGIPLFYTADFSSSRTFYFQSFNDPNVYMFNTILDLPCVTKP